MATNSQKKEFILPAGVEISAWDKKLRRYTINDHLMRNVHYATSAAEAQEIIDGLRPSAPETVEPGDNNNDPNNQPPQTEETT